MKGYVSLLLLIRTRIFFLTRLNKIVDKISNKTMNICIVFFSRISFLENETKFLPYTFPEILEKFEARKDIYNKKGKIIYWVQLTSIASMNNNRTKKDQDKYMRVVCCLGKENINFYRSHKHHKLNQDYRVDWIGISCSIVVPLIQISLICRDDWN